MSGFLTAAGLSDATSNSTTVDLGNSSHGRLTLTNVTDDQIAGPDWIKDHRTLFNIVPQVGPDTPRDTLRRMALRLLTESIRVDTGHCERLGAWSH